MGMRRCWHRGRRGGEARVTRVAVLAAGIAAASATGCASLQEIDGTQFGANFPTGPGRTYYLKKSLFRTVILVCDGGPGDAVCFEKPH